jgi:hypothetical protein
MTRFFAYIMTQPNEPDNHQARSNFIRQQKTCHRHDFVVKVADNFDENPDGIHGDVKSIHILNQIFVTTQENDEVPIIVRMILGVRVEQIPNERSVV